MPDENKDGDVDMTQDVDNSDNKSDSLKEISAATNNIRLPPFWSNNPRVWFIASEVQFTIHKIVKDELKYAQIILSLTPEQCESVLDILQNPPASNKYEIMKAALIERNSMSEEKQLEALLEKSDIGDRRPSEVLRHIRNLAGPNLSQQLIKSLWFRKMPEFIRLALIPQEDSKTVDDLAKTADKLNEAVSTHTTIAAITRPGRSTQRQESFRPSLSHEQSQGSSTGSDTLEGRLKRVEATLARLSNRSRSRSQNYQFPSGGRARSNSKNRSNSRFRSGGRSNQTEQCWYHDTFKDSAKKCKPPCNHPNSKYKNDNIDNKPPNN